ncbi:AraC family transcriptional regulator [Nocardia sp. GCM10030253]|uniref:AraC family transcriptional regulator n=1 Tax=Nocardia sp. GCM10030253 TaxID=3273404 RepID=UPI0036315D12
MDVLSDALAAMRTGQTRSARTDVRAPWGLRFPTVTGTTFHVVMQGTCWLLSEGSATPLALGPGDVVFLRDGSAHALVDDPATPQVDFVPERADPSSTIGQVRIDGSGAHSVLLCGAYELDRTRSHPLMNELPGLVHLPARSAKHSELRHLIDLLATELDQQRPGGDAIVPALIDAMLLYILRAWIDDRSATETGAEASSGWALALTDPAIGRALQDIHAHPAHSWTVQELAARSGLSRSVFAQRFTGLVGEPPLTYLSWWRMTTAGRLLRESDAPLSAVARRVGYTSEFAFAKAFKREYGTPPGRYRRPAPIVAPV